MPQIPGLVREENNQKPKRGFLVKFLSLMGAISSEEQRKEENFDKKELTDSCAENPSPPGDSGKYKPLKFPLSFDGKPQMSYPSRETLPTSCEALCFNGGAEIIDRLYIGDVHLAARALSTEDHMGFSHILSLFSSSVLSSFCKETSPPEPIIPFRRSERPVIAHFEEVIRGSRLVRLVIPLNDTPMQGILHVLKPCFEFIDEGIREGAVLVHCMAGVSRSAAIVTAYLMRTLELPVKDALKLLRKKHNRASPNFGFLQQLQWFEKICLHDERKAEGLPTVVRENLKTLVPASNQSSIRDVSSTEEERLKTILPTSGL